MFLWTLAIGEQRQELLALFRQRLLPPTAARFSVEVFGSQSGVTEPNMTLEAFLALAQPSA